jgi:hypothetical protein
MMINARASGIKTLHCAKVKSSTYDGHSFDIIGHISELIHTRRLSTSRFNC